MLFNCFVNIFHRNAANLSASYDANSHGGSKEDDVRHYISPTALSNFLRKHGKDVTDFEQSNQTCRHSINFMRSHLNFWLR